MKKSTAISMSVGALVFALFTGAPQAVSSAIDGRAAPGRAAAEMTAPTKAYDFASQTVPQGVTVAKAYPALAVPFALFDDLTDSLRTAEASYRLNKCSDAVKSVSDPGSKREDALATCATNLDDAVDVYAEANLSATTRAAVESVCPGTRAGSTFKIDENVPGYGARSFTELAAAYLSLGAGSEREYTNIASIDALIAEIPEDDLCAVR